MASRRTQTVPASAELITNLESLSETITTSWDGTYGPESVEFLRQWCTVDFYMDWSHGQYNLAPTPTLEQHIEQLELLKKVNPAWRMNAYNFTAVLDREANAGIVMFTSGPSGNPGNPGEWSMNRESVSKLMWRRRQSDGGWECFGHQVIRGGGLAVPEIA